MFSMKHCLHPLLPKHRNSKKAILSGTSDITMLVYVLPSIESNLFKNSLLNITMSLHTFSQYFMLSYTQYCVCFQIIILAFYVFKCVYLLMLCVRLTCIE